MRITIWYRIETDQSSIWMPRRGLPVEYFYSIKDSFYLKMCLSFHFFFFFFSFQKLGGGGVGGRGLPERGPWYNTVFQITHQLSTFFLKFFFFFDRRIYESVNLFSLLVSRLQGYPNIEHLYLADSSLARVGFRSIYLFTTLSSEILFSSNSIQ